LEIYWESMWKRCHSS